jgi:hypothetical protein
MVLIPLFVLTGWQCKVGERWGISTVPPSWRPVCRRPVRPSTWIWCRRYVGGAWGSLTTNSLGSLLAREFALPCVRQRHVRPWNSLPAELPGPLYCIFWLQTPKERVLSNPKSKHRKSRSRRVSSKRFPVKPNRIKLVLLITQMDEFFPSQ